MIYLFIAGFNLFAAIIPGDIYLTALNYAVVLVFFGLFLRDINQSKVREGK